MFKKETAGYLLAGCCAGIINGLFGAGGGMVLVPLLSRFCNLKDTEIFPASVAVILPLCMGSLGVASGHAPLPWLEAAPYLIGSLFGGIAAGLWGRKIPVQWLHKGLGIFILWGGIRYLC